MNKRWNELLIGYMTRQYQPETNCISKHEPIMCREKIQQHTEALRILHGLMKFHHYCFARKLSEITDHEPLKGISKNGVAILSQSPQCILLRIQQWINKLHNFSPDFFNVNWLSRQNPSED